MPNRLYTNMAQLKMGGGVHALPNFTSDTFKVHALDAADHTTDLDADIDEADITDLAIVATATLAGLSATEGQWRVDPATFLAVAGDEFEELVIWQDTGVDTTSPLVCRFDTAVNGLPFTPTGGDILVSWGSYIFTHV